MAAEERPARACRDLLVVPVDDETLVYDRDRHRAHSLARGAAAIWQACDGRRSPAAIAAAVARRTGEPVGEELVRAVLRRLRRAGLLDPGYVPATSPARRRFVLGTGALTAFAVLSMTVPASGQAATCRPNGQACTASAQCCSGCCRSGLNRCLPPTPIAPCL